MARNDRHGVKQVVHLANTWKARLRVKPTDDALELSIGEGHLDQGSWPNQWGKSLRQPVGEQTAGASQLGEDSYLREPMGKGRVQATLLTGARHRRSRPLHRLLLDDLDRLLSRQEMLTRCPHEIPEQRMG